MELNKTKKRYLSIGQAADALGLTRLAVIKVFEKRQMNFIFTVGGHRRVLESDLIKLLQEGASVE